MKSIKKNVGFMAIIIVLSILIGAGMFAGGTLAADKAAGEADVTTKSAITASESDYWFRMLEENPVKGGVLEIREGDDVDLRWWDDYEQHEDWTRMELCVPVERGDIAIGNDDLNWTSSDNDIIEIYAYGDEGITLWNVKKSGEVTITAEIKEGVVIRGLPDGFTGGSITFNVIDSQATSDFYISILNAKESYKPGEYVNIEASAENSTEEEKDALLITALYSGDKMLLHSGSGNKVEAGESIKLSSGFLLPENSAGYKIKVFVWDKWYDPATGTGGEALSDVIEINVAE